MGFACRIWRSSKPNRPNLDVSERVEEVDTIELDRACDCPVFRRYDALRGRPTLGMVDVKELDGPKDGECACPGVPSLGACASVAIAARY